MKKTNRRKNNRKRRTRTLMTETLETRQLMAADISFSKGVMYIEGTNSADQVVVSKANKSGSKVQVLVGKAKPLVYTAKYIKSIRFDGNAGNDKFVNDTRIPSKAYGGSGHDRLYGGSSNDVLQGGTGNDFVAGRSGNDKLYGNSGNDTLEGGHGNDYLSGYTGNDVLKGSSGNDRLLGSNGNDKLYGGSGNDRLEGGNDNDYLRGSTGKDLLLGGNGNDKLYGDQHADRLFGQSGHDHLDGGADNDYLSGYYGNDVLRGGSGHDHLQGSDGNDKLYGGSGNDRLEGGRHHDYLRGGSGKDKLEGGSGHDKLYGDQHADKLYGSSGNDLLEGGSGNDYLSGYSGDDTLKGGTGNDTLRGGSGDDRLYGNSGHDDLNGDSGNDYLSGYSGNDMLRGGADNDVIYGSGGNDTIYGNSGNDFLDGGSGNDYLSGHVGHDTLRGGSGNDKLKGASGNDKLDGGKGIDVLDGGTGRDQFFGSLGSDRIRDTELEQTKASQQTLGSSLNSLFDGMSARQRAAVQAEFLKARDADVGFNLGGWASKQINAGKIYVGNAWSKVKASPKDALKHLGNEAEDILQNFGTLLVTTIQDVPADALRILRRLGVDFQKAKTPRQLGGVMWNFVRDASMFKSVHTLDADVDFGSTVIGSLFGRSLNQGEKNFAHRIFGKETNVSATRIVTSKHFSSGMYGGNVIFMKENPLKDVDSRALFAHELTHLYQDQNVLMAGTVQATREAFTYHTKKRNVYQVDMGRETSFWDLQPEQQAVIVEHAYIAIERSAHFRTEFDNYNDNHFMGKANNAADLENFLRRRIREAGLFR